MAKGKKEPKVKIPEGGDKSTGKAIFEQQCSACHSAEAGDDKTAAAPSLAAIVGRVAGSSTFPYSPAMKKSGITWTDKHLFAYIKAPAKYVPGTRMAFAGIQDDKERADLLAYLESL